MGVERISEELKGVKPGKDFSVFLVCLLIAFLFWLLNAFTKAYSTVIEIPIEYVNIPNDKILSKALPDKTSAEISGTGFRLLSVSFLDTPEPIEIDFHQGNKQAGFKKVVSSFGPEALRAQVLDEIPSELSLGSLSIDSLKVVVEDKSEREVYVASEIDFKVEYPFFLNGEVSITPSSVTILGANSVVQGIDSIRTQELELGNVQKRITKDIELQFPMGVESEMKKVSISIPVDEFTEGVLEVPITINNLPVDQELILLPSAITVTYLVGLSEYDKVNAGSFEFSVDASSIVKGKTTLIVKQNKVPSFVEVQDFSPHKLEFILKK
ncbi:MAG: hypothetical protein CL840_11220 [Crocinitomicaceae bacterium]|nr:hypothetical protein [Crocinitomicaceae bacterium]